MYIVFYPGRTAVSTDDPVGFMETLAECKDWHGETWVQDSDAIFHSERERAEIVAELPATCTCVAWSK